MTMDGKKRASGGYTLIEMMVSLLILVMLIVAIDIGSTTAWRVYRESVFRSNSASLEYIINTSLEDVLRYSERVYARSGEKLIYEDQTIPASVLTNGKAACNFLFTNYEHGVQNGYFRIMTGSDGHHYISMASMSDSKMHDLVNAGAYPKLSVEEFKVSFDPGRKVFTYSYTIRSLKSNDLIYKVPDQIISLINTQ